MGLHETGQTSKKVTSARPVTSSKEQMTDLDMKCCFCKRKSSRNYLNTRSHAAEKNVVARIDEGDIPRTSADRPSIQIVEIVRRTVWVEKGSKRQLKDLLDSLVSFVTGEHSHGKSTAADESGTKLPDHGPACIINSESLKEEPQILVQERSECKRSWQLGHVGGNPAADAIVTKLDKVPCSESKATELSPSMKAKKSNNKSNLIRHGAKTPAADKALQLPEVGCGNCKDSEPSSSMRVQTTKTAGHADSVGHSVNAPHGSITVSEGVECKLTGLIQVKESWKTHTSNNHGGFQSNTPATAADHGGISVKLESIAEAGGLSFNRADRSLKANNNPKKSKKKRSSSSGGENRHEMNSRAADGIVTQLDGGASSISRSVETSPSLKAKKLEKHRLSSSGGENGHGQKSIPANSSAMKLEDVAASCVPDRVELPASVKLGTFKKNSSISGPDENTCGNDIGAADGILTKLEENVGEYSSPLESHLAISVKKPKENPSSNGGHAGENAYKRNGCAAASVVGIKREPVLVDSSISCGSQHRVKVKKPKKMLHHNSSGGILQHRNNPAIQDFIRELKKQCAGCDKKLMNSSDSIPVGKRMVKRCSDSAFVGNLHETTSHPADGVGIELDHGAACAYSKSVERPRSQKIEKLKENCRHESGTKNIDGKNTSSADGVGIKLPSRSSKSSEVSWPRKAKRSKHISISGGQNALEKTSTLPYDSVAIKRDNSTCSSLQSRRTTPFREIQARKFKEKQKQDDSANNGHGRSMDAHGANVTKLENNGGAWLDPESLETRPVSKQQLKWSGSHACAGEITYWWEVASDEGNGLLYAKSPTSRRKLKGSKKRHRRGHDSSSLSDSDGDISQVFDFKGEDTPLFFIPSIKEKKKVRFDLSEEGEIAEVDEERTKRSPRNVHNIPETRFGKLTQAGDETIKKCVDNCMAAEEGQIAEEDEERTKRSPRNVHNIPETRFGKLTQAGEETIKKCVDNCMEAEEAQIAEEDEERTKQSPRNDHNIPETRFGKLTQAREETIKKCADNCMEERDRDNIKGNYNEARGAGVANTCRVKRLNSRARGALEGGNPGKWSQEEEERMRTLLMQYGPAWKKIGRILDRPAQACVDKWRSFRLTPQLKTGPWTQEEQDQLQSYVLQGLEAKQKLAKKEVDRSEWRRNDVNWEEIAHKMNRRSKACAYVWYTKICPFLLGEKSDGKSLSAIGFPRRAAGNPGSGDYTLGQ